MEENSQALFEEQEFEMPSRPSGDFKENVGFCRGAARPSSGGFGICDLLHPSFYFGACLQRGDH